MWLCTVGPEMPTLIFPCTDISFWTNQSFEPRSQSLWAKFAWAPWNLWGMGWKRFRWRQKELGNLQKMSTFSSPPLEFLQMNLPLGRQNLCYNKLTKKNWCMWSFSESTCNFWTITQRGPCFSQQSMRLSLGSRQKASDWPPEWFLPELS